MDHYTLTTKDSGKGMKVERGLAKLVQGNDKIAEFETSGGLQGLEIGIVYPAS